MEVLGMLTLVYLTAAALLAAPFATCYAAFHWGIS